MYHDQSSMAVTLLAIGDLIRLERRSPPGRRNAVRRAPEAPSIPRSCRNPLRLMVLSSSSLRASSCALGDCLSDIPFSAPLVCRL